jgi:hypothetical protein
VIELKLVLNGLKLLLSKIDLLEEAKHSLNWGAEVAAWSSIKHWNIA